MEKEEQQLSALDKYRAELERDTELSIRNLREKSLSLSALQAKWTGYYVEEKSQLRRLGELRSQYVTQKLQKEKGSALDKMKSSAAPDETLTKIDKTKHELELCIEFIHEAMAIMANMSFNVKNSIEIFKMENA